MVVRVVSNLTYAFFPLSNDNKLYYYTECANSIKIEVIKGLLSFEIKIYFAMVIQKSFAPWPKNKCRLKPNILSGSTFLSKLLVI